MTMHGEAGEQRRPQRRRRARAAGGSGGGRSRRAARVGAGVAGGGVRRGFPVGGRVRFGHTRKVSDDVATDQGRDGRAEIRRRRVTVAGHSGDAAAGAPWPRRCRSGRAGGGARCPGRPGRGTGRDDVGGPLAEGEPVLRRRAPSRWRWPPAAPAPARRCPAPSPVRWPIPIRSSWSARPGSWPSGTPRSAVPGVGGDRHRARRRPLPRGGRGRARRHRRPRRTAGRARRADRRTRRCSGAPRWLWPASTIPG